MKTSVNHSHYPSQTRRPRNINLSECFSSDQRHIFQNINVCGRLRCQIQHMRPLNWSYSKSGRCFWIKIKFLCSGRPNFDKNVQPLPQHLACVLIPGPALEPLHVEPPFKTLDYGCYGNETLYWQLEISPSFRIIVWGWLIGRTKYIKQPVFHKYFIKNIDCPRHAVAIGSSRRHLLKSLYVFVELFE